MANLILIRIPITPLFKRAFLKSLRMRFWIALSLNNSPPHALSFLPLVHTSKDLGISSFLLIASLGCFKDQEKKDQEEERKERIRRGQELIKRSKFGLDS